MSERTSGSQDPALFEDSPAVQAAVLEERRFNNLGAKVDQVIEALRQLNEKVAIANGRTSKNEAALEAIRDEHVALRQQVKDRRLWERLDLIENWRTARDKDAARQDGVQEGKVSLRTADKAWFGLFITTAISLAAIFVKFV